MDNGFGGNNNNNKYLVRAAHGMNSENLNLEGFWNKAY